MEILWEEEGFQSGFKRWQGWAVSKVLWEWVPNVGSKARERAKAMSLVIVLLDFQHVGVRNRLTDKFSRIYLAQGSFQNLAFRLFSQQHQWINLKVFVVFTPFCLHSSAALGEGYYWVCQQWQNFWHTHKVNVCLVSVRLRADWCMFQLLYYIQSFYSCLSLPKPKVGISSQNDIVTHKSIYIYI